MELIASLGRTFMSTTIDMAPIIAILFGFQYLVLRKRLQAARQIIIGLIWTWAGLSLFLVGLDMALLPLGEAMAAQLIPVADPGMGMASGDYWRAYGWLYAFAAGIVASAALAEPGLIALSIKAEEASGGQIRAVMLRYAVAVGMALGATLGVTRAIGGIDLMTLLMPLIGLLALQALTAPKFIVALAFDAGPATVSTVTVPLIAALSLGLAHALPERSALGDGFGMLTLAYLCPITAVLGYAQLSDWLSRRRPPP